MKALFTSAILLAVALTGCTSTERYTDTAYPATLPSHVEVVDLHQIQHKYAIIGEVQAYGAGTNEMRKKAAALGADAISIPVMNANGVSFSQAIKYKE